MVVYHTVGGSEFPIEMAVKFLGKPKVAVLSSTQDILNVIGAA